MRVDRLVLVAGAVLAAAAARGQDGGTTRSTPVAGWRVEPFALVNDSAGFRLALKGYAQADLRSFRDWPPDHGEGRILPADEAEWRRVRAGFEGEWKRLSFEFQADAVDEGDELKDLWVAFRFARELRIRGGHMKLPLSPEFLTSAAKTDFVERAATVDALAPGRDWGAVVYGEAGRALEYELGLFEGDGRTSDTRAETTGTARLVLKPARWLDVGGSFSHADVEAAPAGPGFDPEPKGFRARSATRYGFVSPMFVDGRRVRWGVDARLERGPVSLWGEYLEQREERTGQGPSLEDLPSVRGNGWSANATWLVSGEKKSRTIKPHRSLFGGPGAVEIAARYESLDVDDVSNDGFESAGNRARNVRPAGYRAFTGGLSWWPGPFLRLMGNAVLERYDDALRSPEPGKEGTYVSFLARIQVYLP